jgi:hypothetical protein
MQVLSSALKAALIDIDARVVPRTLVDCYEFYSYDAVPGVNGFDPADAIETFAAEELTWNGIAYRREAISRGDINKNMGEKTNSCTLTFSNISRYLATLAQSQEMEGLLVVIRCVVPSVTDDSLVLFVGRCDKPSDIDKKTFTLSARQDFGNINQQLPPRKFTSEDPEGRLPGDLLYEGIQFTAINGSYTYPSVVPATGFFGRLFGQRDTVRNTEQYSSIDNTPYGNVLREIFGRAQVELTPFVWADKGIFLTALWAVSNGPIAAVQNIKTRTEGLSNPINSFNTPPAPAVVHLGDLGGTGTNQGNTGQADIGGGQVFSHLAYIEGAIIPTEYFTNPSLSDPNILNELPIVTALVKGRIVPLPDGTGEYILEGWTDNPVHIARFILTQPAWVGINEAFMEDSVNYLTALHCDEPLIDESNDQIIVIPNPDLPRTPDPDFPVDDQPELPIPRFPSTGILDSQYVRYYEFDQLEPPEYAHGPYVGVNLDETPFLETQRILKKRYTLNCPITGEVRAVDFLYKTALPTFKGFLRVNKRGKYEIRSEQPSDATHIRSATAVNAASIPVLDVTPWKTGPDLLIGRILLGNTLITSEVRDVTSADFSTSGNSISLAASATGGVTAVASGGFLSGGSTSAQASGTVTIGGSPAATNTVTVTIDGIAVTHTLDGNDNVNTVAAMLMYWINATARLRQFVKAEWNSASPTVLTIKCLHGALNVTPALLKAHTGPVADPTTAPTVAAAAGGSLATGAYQLAYANVNSLGSTVLTARASVVVTANQKINITGLPALPVGITARNFYLSEQANSTNLRYSTTRTDAANFSISAVPVGAAVPPTKNTTAEELLRVAMSFATNSQDVFPAWSPNTATIIGDIWLPTVPNGHKYDISAVTTGLTGATEPTWPTTVGGTVVNGGVTFREIGSTVLQQAGLTRANIIKDSFKWPLGSRQSSVNQVKGSYRDAKNDFALTPLRVNDRAHQLQVKKTYPLEFDGSGIDSFHQFNRVANWLLSKNREGDWFNSLGTGPQGLVLEEGDTICSSDDSGGLINVVTRIEDLRIRPNHEVIINQARKYSTLMFSDDVGSHNIPIASTLRFVETVDSIIQFIDTFAIRESDKLVPGFKVSVTRDLAVEGDWRGWVLYADYGDGYRQVAEGDVAATLGTATTTLGTVTDATVLDTFNSLTFTLKFEREPPFASIPSADLLDNPYRNLLLVGNEYLQFATVVSNGNHSYTISNLWRGRFYTDWTELTHGASERVVFMDGSEVFVPTDVSRIDLPFNYKVVTTNQDLADATPVSFTWTGKSMKLPVVRSFTMYKEGSGLKGFKWTSGAPLENQEYVLQILTLAGSATLTNGRERIMRVIPGMGNPVLFEGSTSTTTTTQKALSSSLVTTDYAHGNTFVTPASGPPFLNYCRSLLTLEQPGFWIEFSPPVLTKFAGIGSFLRLANATDAIATPTAIYEVEVQDYSVVDDPSREWGVDFIIRERRPGGSLVVIYTDTNVDVTQHRYRIQSSGSEVRFYRNYTGPGTEPLVVSKIALPSNLKIFGETASNQASEIGMQNIVLGGLTKPYTTYSISQQTEDFGSVQSSIRAKVHQERADGVDGIARDVTF